MTAILELASKLANDLIRPPKFKQLFIVLTELIYVGLWSIWRDTFWAFFIIFRFKWMSMRMNFDGRSQTEAISSSLGIQC